MFNNLKIVWHQGKQYIPDVTTAKVPGIFRGRPIISPNKADEEERCPNLPDRSHRQRPGCIDLGNALFAVNVHAVP